MDLFHTTYHRPVVPVQMGMHVCGVPTVWHNGMAYLADRFLHVHNSINFREPKMAPDYTRCSPFCDLVNNVWHAVLTHLG